MDLTFNEHETEFRDALRAWLALTPPGGTPDGDGRDRYAWLRDWQRRLHEGGWAGVDWPVEYGGVGTLV
jgi:alkylation response protein AidB-like acyl-CoA dehydrogenase